MESSSRSVSGDLPYSFGSKLPGSPSPGFCMSATISIASQARGDTSREPSISPTACLSPFPVCAQTDLDWQNTPAQHLSRSAAHTRSHRPNVSPRLVPENSIYHTDTGRALSLLRRDCVSGRYVQNPITNGLLFYRSPCFIVQAKINALTAYMTGTC